MQRIFDSVVSSANESLKTDRITTRKAQGTLQKREAGM